MKPLLQRIATRHPYLCAFALFTLIMSGVKIGVAQIVTSYGVIGGLLTIAALIGFSALIDRR